MFVEELAQEIEITLIAVITKVFGHRAQAGAHDVEKLLAFDRIAALDDLNVSTFLREGDEPPAQLKVGNDLHEDRNGVVDVGKVEESDVIPSDPVREGRVSNQRRSDRCAVNWSFPCDSVFSLTHHEGEELSDSSSKRMARDVESLLDERGLSEFLLVVLFEEGEEILGVRVEAFVDLG